MQLFVIYTNMSKYLTLFCVIVITVYFACQCKIYTVLELSLLVYQEIRCGAFLAHIYLLAQCACALGNAVGLLEPIVM